MVKWGMRLFLGLAILGLSGCVVYWQKTYPTINVVSLPVNKTMIRASLIDHIGHSTVALVRYDAGNKENISDIKVYCSGIWIDKTHIITANHCIIKLMEDFELKQYAVSHVSLCDMTKVYQNKCPQTKEIKINEKGLLVHYIKWEEAGNPGQNPTAWHLASVLKWDVDHDIAELVVEGETDSHQFLEIGNGIPEIGSPVHMVGHLKGLYWTFMDGFVSSYRNWLPDVDKVGPYLQIEAPLYYGGSGGPAVNDDGKLIGMANFVLDLPGFGFYIPSDVIKSFAK